MGYYNDNNDVPSDYWNQNWAISVLLVQYLIYEPFLWAD